MKIGGRFIALSVTSTLAAFVACSGYGSDADPAPPAPTPDASDEPAPVLPDAPVPTPVDATVRPTAVQIEAGEVDPSRVCWLHGLRRRSGEQGLVLGSQQLRTDRPRRGRLGLTLDGGTPVAWGSNGTVARLGHPLKSNGDETNGENFTLTPVLGLP